MTDEQKKKVDEILLAARREAAISPSWADFSIFLFDPEEGLLPGVFPTEAERRRFIKSAEYAELTKLRDEVRERTGLIEGAVPQKSGKFLVRLPRTMHAALEAEAQREGVSLNQLVVAKLAVPMPNLFARPTA
jgi:predicted HicB family RNase H-like nuclease